MLDPALVTQLAAHLTKVVHPIELQTSLDASPRSAEMAEMLDEIAAQSDKITVVRTDDDARRPSFAIVRVGTDISVRFAGLPLGHEFTSLVLALLQVGGHPPAISDDLQAQIRALDVELEIETFFSQSCQNCPDVVQAFNAISVLNPRIRHTSIDGAAFPDEAESRQVLAVPTVFSNGDLFESGRMTVEQILSKLDTGADARRAEELNNKEPFDMLVVGGGPAGASAAIYAARKGIRTGLAVERFGGQVLDTLSIENFISVSHTEGPKLVTELEAHVNDYDVDVMHLQEAVSLVGPEAPGAPISVQLANGATLTSRAVVLATGARPRKVGVPGEDDYRNKGVTYCHHCDAPLFAGKPVAVVGGGNSGVEAAIDLASIATEVTLLEFDSQLRADEVLVRKLRSFDNVRIVTDAESNEIHGDGAVVTGLTYTDRRSGESHTLDVQGVFVQIGLLPNTEWLEGTVELSPQREVIIDDHGRTSLPGVYAAGDCTTVPFKQIVIAMGAGSTAALSAFDYLIRNSADAESDESVLVGSSS